MLTYKTACQLHESIGSYEMGYRPTKFISYPFSNHISPSHHHIKRYLSTASGRTDHNAVENRPVSPKKNCFTGSTDAILQRIDSISPKYLAKFFFQQCRMRQELKPKHVARITRALTTHANLLSHRDVSRVIEACYLINFIDFELFKTLAARLTLKLHCLDSETTSRLAFSFSRMGVAYAPLYSGLSARFMATIDTAVPASLTRMAVSFGRLGLRDEELFGN